MSDLDLMVAPLGRAIPQVRSKDRFDQLVEDMTADPEGHFWSTGPGDLRIPPMYQSLTAVPSEIIEGVREVARNAERAAWAAFEPLFNWWDKSFDICRWVAEWEVQSDGVALLTQVPDALMSWSAVERSSYGTRSWLDVFQQGFAPPGDRERRAQRHMREIDDAQHVTQMLAEKVSGGVATEEDMERYEAAMEVLAAIEDPGGFQREHAERVGWEFAKLIGEQL